MELLDNASQAKHPLIKPSDIHTLFYCLPELISISEKILYKLEEYAQCPVEENVASVIGKIFKDLEQEFAVYLKYAVHYQSHFKSIRRASHSGIILKIDRQSKCCKDNNRLGLSDYLIAPFQRIPRYGLLIRGKYAPSTA